MFRAGCFLRPAPSAPPRRPGLGFGQRRRARGAHRKWSCAGGRGRAPRPAAPARGLLCLLPPVPGFDLRCCAAPARALAGPGRLGDHRRAGHSRWCPPAAAASMPAPAPAPPPRRLPPASRPPAPPRSALPRPRSAASAGTSSPRPRARKAHPRHRHSPHALPPAQRQLPQRLLAAVRPPRRVRGDLRAVQRDCPQLPHPSRRTNTSTSLNRASTAPGTRRGTGASSK